MLLIPGNSFILQKQKGGSPAASLFRTLSLDRMSFGDYDNVPVNSTRQIKQKGRLFVVLRHRIVSLEPIAAEIRGSCTQYAGRGRMIGTKCRSKPSQTAIALYLVYLARGGRSFCLSYLLPHRLALIRTNNRTVLIISLLKKTIERSEILVDKS